MKNTGKNSSNKQNEDTLIYIFLAVLVAAAVVGILVYHYWPSSGEPKTSFNYEQELGKRIASPNVEEVSKLLSENQSRKKTIERGLESPNKKLSAKQKDKIRKEFEAFKNNFDDLVKSIDLRTLDSQRLAEIYSELYERGKTLARLKHAVINDRPFVEFKKQWLVTQEEWKISAKEKKEMDDQLDRFISHWYQQFMDNKLTEEERKLKGWIYIKPEIVKGREVTNPKSPADINFFKRGWNFPSGEFIDLTKPTHIEFEGYEGFILPEDLKDSTEGSMTMGLTLSPGVSQTITEGKSGTDNYSKCSIFPNNYRPSTIKLREELFFNREGYDEWMTSYSEDNEGQKCSFYDITWGSVVETIAHELAHAVINCLHPVYDGERKGGHGKLHDDFQERIEEMMRESPEFSEFETWWLKKIKK